MAIERPLDLDVRLRIARTYRLMGKPDEALTHYRTVAKYLALAGQPYLAIAVAKELLQVNPSHTETLLLLAKLYASTGGGGTMAGRVALPQQEGVVRNNLGEWPTTATGIWRAIRPSQNSGQGLLAMLQQPGRSMPGPQSLPPPVPDPSSDKGPRTPSKVTPTKPVASSLGPAPLAVDEADVMEDAALVSADDLDLDVSVEDVDGEGIDTDEPLSLPSGNSFASLSTEVRKLLPSVPLFSALDNATFSSVSDAMVFRTAKAGEMLWREGDDAPYVIIVASGEASSSRAQAGQRLDPVRVGPGGIAGLFALLSERTRASSLQAATELSFFELHRRVVNHFTKSSPAFAQAMQNFLRDLLVDTALCMLPIFRDMEPAVRADVVQRFKTKQYRDGDELAYEGAEVSGLWMILEGKVLVSTETSSGDTNLKNTLLPGHFLGTVSGLEHAQTDAAAMAKGTVTTVTLNHRAMMELAAVHPAVAQLRVPATAEGFFITKHLFAGSTQLPPPSSPAAVKCRRVL